MKKIYFSVNFIISLVIMIGFGLTTLYSYYSSQKLFRSDVEAVSELTSENIFVNINNLMDRPMNVSLTMANDTFLRDFMNNEAEYEESPERIQTIKDYLASYQEKYNFDSVFFVSVKTGNYYHFRNGIDRVMTKDHSENVWYYDFLKDTRECALNVDNDEAKGDNITIFVNCKLYDEEDQILGVVGVGMETPYIQEFLSENENNYGVHAYLIDEKGKVQLSSTLTGFEDVNLFQMEAFKPMADAILHHTKDEEQQWYHSKDADGYVISRYVPNLNWYLVVEKSIVDFKRQMTVQLGIGFLFIAVVVAVVIFLVAAINRRNKQMLLNMAQIDQLTGIKNRTSYEQDMMLYRNQLSTLKQFGIGVFDLNFLKRVNDVYGHQAGDQYIKTFSNLLCDAFYNCSVYRIGGDEFALIFVNLSEEEMLLYANQLYDAIAATKIGDMELSAAFGYAFYQPQILCDVEAIFKEADNRMYADKTRIKKEMGE